MKKAGVTKKKRNRKHEREKEPCHGLFVLTADPKTIRTTASGRRVLQTVLEISQRRTRRHATAILYSGKLGIWDNSLTVAKYLAEEIRANPAVGWQLVEPEVQLRRNVMGFVPIMLKLLGQYLEDPQPVFAKMDYQIADIVEQHPNYSVGEITFELSKQYPEREWTEPKLKTLARRVQRFLENVPR